MSKMIESDQQISHYRQFLLIIKMRILCIFKIYTNISDKIESNENLFYQLRIISVYISL